MKVSRASVAIASAILCIVLIASNRESPEDFKYLESPAILRKPTPKRSLRKIWMGDVDYGYPHSLNVSVVISHCKHDLRWLKDYLRGFDVDSITVVTKCGHPPREKHLPEGAKVIEAPNVGRVDHSIASWMAHSVPDVYQQNDAIVFLKDNLDIHQMSYPRTLFEILSITSVNGFGCFQEPAGGLSHYHHSEVLRIFNMTDYNGQAKYNKKGKKIINDSSNFKSKYENMGAWLDTMKIDLPAPITPVCYGGIFAAKVQNVKRVPTKTWLALEKSLSRADNIEEGHFMERTWGALLSDPLQYSLMKVLGKKADKVNFRVGHDGGGHLGALRKESHHHYSSS